MEKIQFSIPIQFGALKTFEALAYSGKQVSYYDDKIIIDTATLSYSEKIPILTGHDPNKRTGFASVADSQNRIFIKGEILDNEHGDKIFADTKQGFPMQMSVGIEFSKRRKVKKSEMVNGHLLEDGYVLEGATLREVSFTGLGVDSDTFVIMEKNMELEQALLEIKALGIQLAQSKADNENQGKEILALKQQLINIGKKEREVGVKAMFEMLGREYSEANAAVYMSMDKPSFDQITTDIKEMHSKTANNDLYTEKASFSKGDQDNFAKLFEKYGVGS